MVSRIRNSFSMSTIGVRSGTLGSADISVHLSYDLDTFKVIDEFKFTQPSIDEKMVTILLPEDGMQGFDYEKARKDPVQTYAYSLAVEELVGIEVQK